MRQVHLMDLDAVVRAVVHLDATARRARLRQIVERACWADKYRKRLRKPHPEFGTGTLASAIGEPHTPAIACDSHYRLCLSDLLNILGD